MGTDQPASVEGRRVVITGGSRGIGRGLAIELATRGATLALVARPSDDLEHAANATGGTAYPCDLGDPKAVLALCERIEADGAVDVLINNAGMESVGHATELTHEGIDQLLQVNLHAPIHLAQDWLPRMIERGRGHIVNVSSMAAVMTPPGLTAYSASKAGLSAYTAALRNDLRDLPITLSTVHLGTVDTEMTERTLQYAPFAAASERSKGREVISVKAAVRAIADGIEKGRADIAVPRMMSPLSAMAALPRAITRGLFRGTDLSPSN